MIMDNRKEIVEKMINALNGRGGFDDWWHNIDEEIQAEITDELVKILPIQNVSNSLYDNYKIMENASQKAASEIKAFCESVMHEDSDLHGYADEWIEKRLK